MRVLDMRQLVAALIRKRFYAQETFLGHLVMQLCAGHRMCQRNLNRFAVQLLGEINRLLDRFLGLTGQTDDEVTVHLDANLLAVLHELARHINSRALLDVLQDLRIAGFKANDKEPRATIRHRFQLFVLAMATRGAGPLKLQWLEFLTQFNRTVLANIERVIVEEYLFHLREVFQRLLHFANDVVHRTRAPRMAGNRLRPHTERAHRRATARRIERYERVQQERHVVALDLQVTLVNIGSKRQSIELFRVQLRPRRVVHDLAVLAIAGSGNLLKRFAMRVFGDGMVKLAAHEKINIFARRQSFIRTDMSVWTNERDLDPRMNFFDLADELQVAMESNRGRIKNQEFVALADFNGLLPIHLVRRSVQQPAARN